ncbi:MAG: hypothetical protein ABW092_03290 [Candidatus Thiodiazotropha sp.]
MEAITRFMRILVLTFTFAALVFLLLSFLSVMYPLPYIRTWVLVVVLSVSLAASAWFVFGEHQIAKRTSLIAVIGGIIFLLAGIYLLGKVRFEQVAIYTIQFAVLAVLAGLLLQATVSWGKWGIAITTTVLVLIVMAFISILYPDHPFNESPSYQKELPPAQTELPPAQSESPPAQSESPPAQSQSPTVQPWPVPPLSFPEQPQSDSLPNYEWPPETPSWTYQILQGSDGSGVSLYDISERLYLALRSVNYFEYSYYRAPGGFVMVTRLEAIDTEGAPLQGERRFLLPSDDRDFEFAEYIRSLFFAPTGHYRFIAFVVTDKPYVASPDVLSETTALNRLQGGATGLPVGFHQIPFSSSHRIDALIYEFRKTGDADVKTLVPGRIPPDSHMGQSGLRTALLEYLQ